MNSIISCSIAAFIFGVLASGFVVYKIEEDKILTIQAAQQQAIVEAENRVIVKQTQGETINQQVSKEYEAKIAALNARIAAGSLRKTGTGNGVPKIRASSSGTVDSCTAIKIQLNSLIDDINKRAAAFNK